MYDLRYCTIKSIYGTPHTYTVCMCMDKYQQSRVLLIQYKKYSIYSRTPNALRYACIVMYQSGQRVQYRYCAYLGFLCVAPPPHVRAVESSLLRQFNPPNYNLTPDKPLIIRYCTVQYLSIQAPIYCMYIYIHLYISSLLLLCCQQAGMFRVLLLL